jgi:hypothetical protein
MVRLLVSLAAIDSLTNQFSVHLIPSYRTPHDLESRVGVPEPVVAVSGSSPP